MCVEREQAKTGKMDKLYESVEYPIHLLGLFQRLNELDEVHGT